MPLPHSVVPSGMPSGWGSPVLAFAAEASVWREAYFDYDSQTWAITMGSDESTAEANKVVFERLLKTFKILD